jgi:hypothetical protein
MIRYPASQRETLAHPQGPWLLPRGHTACGWAPAAPLPPRVIYRPNPLPRSLGGGGIPAAAAAATKPTSPAAAHPNMQAASETATVAVLARDLIGKFVRARGIDGLVQKVLDPEKGSASGKAGSKKKKPPAATHVQIVSPFGESPFGAAGADSC